jgi:hypothetical protein
MLRDLEHQAVAAIGGLQRVENFRQMIGELHVDDGADDLGDASDSVGHISSSLRSGHSASAPEMISMSSLVIIA